MSAPRAVVEKAAKNPPDQIADQIKAAAGDFVKALVELADDVGSQVEDLAGRLETARDENAELYEDWLKPMQRDFGRLVDAVMDHLERGIADRDEVLALARRFDAEYPDTWAPEGATIR